MGVYTNLQTHTFLTRKNEAGGKVEAILLPRVTKDPSMSEKDLRATTSTCGLLHNSMFLLTFWATTIFPGLRRFGFGVIPGHTPK